MKKPWNISCPVYVMVFAISLHCHTAVQARTTVEVALSMDGISFFLEHEAVDSGRLQELRQAITAIDHKIQRIDESIQDIRQLIQRQLSASAAIDIENRMWNLLNLYNTVLKAVQDLHANKNSYDGGTFVTAAAEIREELDAVLESAAKYLPSDLPSLSRVLLGDTMSGVGSTEGLLCDVVSGTLSKLSEADDATYNLTETIQKGCEAFLSSMITLQEFSIALFNNTCTPTDFVCHRQVAQFREGLGRQRARMESCLPPGLLQLAREGRLAGRLLEAEGGRALTLQDVFFPRADRTEHLPALLPPQDSPSQLVDLEASGRFFRLVLGQTCHLSVQHMYKFGCNAHATAQSALFMVTGNRQGRLGLVNTLMGSHLVGHKGDHCLDRTIQLSKESDFPWKFEAFQPSSSNQGSPVAEAVNCTGSAPAPVPPTRWLLVALCAVAAAATAGVRA